MIVLRPTFDALKGKHSLLVCRQYHGAHGYSSSVAHHASFLPFIESGSTDDVQLFDESLVWTSEWRCALAGETREVVQGSEISFSHARLWICENRKLSKVIWRRLCGCRRAPLGRAIGFVANIAECGVFSAWLDSA